MKKTMNEFLAEVRKVALDPTLASKFEANVAEALVETAEKATVKEEKNMKEITKGFQLMEAINLVKTEERVNFLGVEIRKVDDKTFIFSGKVYPSAESVLSAAILADSKKIFSKKAKEIALYGKVYGGVAVEATKNTAVAVASKAAEETKKAAGKFGQKLIDFSK